MARIAAEPNLLAFLDMLAFSEIGAKLLAESDDGYNVLVGGKLFDGYHDHPRERIFLSKLGIHSTAAGRYQLLARYFDPYKALLKLPDFSPESQDAIAIQQIKECKALKLIEAGDVRGAIDRCKHIWASLPGNLYGQHQQKPADLLSAYLNAGGALA